MMNTYEMTVKNLTDDVQRLKNSVEAKDLAFCAAMAKYNEQVVQIDRLIAEKNILREFVESLGGGNWGLWCRKHGAEECYESRAAKICLAAADAAREG
jgi:hypothetical protein